MNETEILEYLKERHPYPEDLFIPPTKQQWQDFHKVLKDAGYNSSGGFVGECCRIGYNACINILESLIKELDHE